MLVFVAEISSYLYSTETEEKKAQQLEVLKNETVPFYMEKLNALANENNNHFVGGKVNF